LVNEFDTKIPKLEFSPAEILLFLLEYRQSLRDVISNVEAWMTRIRKKGRERGE
jgi:chaperone BCS1